MFEVELIKQIEINIDYILMSPVSRFGGGRAKKKQGVIDRLKAFFEKFFGIGGSIAFTEQEQEPVVYNIDTKSTDEGTVTKY